MKKWKCIKTEYPSNWIIGKIYQENENGSLVNERQKKLTVNGVKYSTKFEEVKDFTLADLKPCMVVKLKCGELYIVSQTVKGLGFVIVEDGNSLYFEDFNDDMTYKKERFSCNDIVEVYGLREDYMIYSMNISADARELLYKRIEKSPTQIKLEELETKQREIADEMAKLRKEVE